MFTVLVELVELGRDDARYVPDLVKALELSKQVVPDDLKALADGFMAKEDEKRKAAKKAQAKEYGFEEDKSDSEDEGVRKAGGDISQQTALAQIAAMAAASKASTGLMQNPLSSAQLLPNAVLPISLPGVLGVSMPGTAAVVPGSGLPGLPNEEATRKAALQAALNLQHNLAKIQADVMLHIMKPTWRLVNFPKMLDGRLPTRKLWAQYQNGLELPLLRGASISHLVGSQDQENGSFTCSLRGY
ncbi:hypothetical protein F3Y22_tig00111215pilonHSYRG00013 [Hibiscus syriacus]|uniref:Uncharacterized protein n=1 Tax=Hibiscus syriacus TaxID=106335 RepID=A0A6A2YVP8_HIBSY|nr:hypothetical protein F3Y22_tig00111215pilonHSYRG00013 [Hibiscus syriacus]